ncbi:hypothetical protein [Robertkochia sediminum]|uniref:hypothetical protein n=1 Tax=Robertkochia sediminum TaxID=2785326 RepID=UPI001933E691|nr:hypothetical protein [Robertkochia sediminum]MBL7471239.1 hypothetical protein [Robertkochia sediminum]
MKRFTLILLFMIVGAPLMAQETPEQESEGMEVDKNAHRVQTFTQEERDNLQLWYYRGLQEMGLTEEQEAQYQSTLTYYAVKMARLDDKDQEWTKEELKEKFKAYLSKQEWEVRKILTPEQYVKHEEMYGEFLRSVYRRFGIGEKIEEAEKN